MIIPTAMATMKETPATTEARTILARIEAKPKRVDRVINGLIKCSAPRVEKKVACRMTEIRTMAMRKFLYAAKTGKVATWGSPACAVSTPKPAWRLRRGQTPL